MNNLKTSVIGSEARKSAGFELHEYQTLLVYILSEWLDTG